MRFPRYPAYKSVQLDYAAEVPSHWTVCALKRIASLKSGDSIGSEQISESGEYPVYGGNGLRGYTSSFTHEGHFVLIGRQGALCGNVNYASGRFWASEHAVVAAPRRELETTWLGETLRAMNLNQYSVSAAQPGLSVGQLGELRVAVPPYDEQLAIAGFLSSEATKIDALVAEQRRLMELLQEKRQAVIAHAVTKGLNPDAPMKPSGVEWLGEVPAHWRIDRFKRSLVAARNGIWGAEPDGGANDIVCVRVADFDRRGLVVALGDEPTLRSVSPEERRGRLLSRGDLLIEKSGGGENQLVGCVVLYDDMRPAVCSNFVARVTMAPEMDPSFWRYVHAAAYAVRLNYRSIKQTSGIQNLDAGQYFDELAPFPPYTEQRAIAAYLDQELKSLDALGHQVESAITLLLEHRAALISAAVTGQIDVRHVAAAEAA